MIVYHGTTDDCLTGIRRDGLSPGSYVSRERALANTYAWDRGMSIGANAAFIIELDVPDEAVVEGQSWWWARDQLMLPFGCAASCILSIMESDDPHAFSED